MLAKLWHIADRLISLSAFIGTLGLIIEVVVIMVDVTGRYFGVPLSGARDVSQMALLILVFGGMALCDRLGGHIAVDVLEPLFPRWLNWLSDVLSPAIGAAIFLIIAWTMWQSAALSNILNLATNIIYLPKAWFQYAVLALCLVTAFGMILKAIAAFGGRTVPIHGHAEPL